MSPFSRPAQVVIVTSVVAWANFLIRACFCGHVSIPPLDAYPTVMAPSRHPVYRPAIPVLAVTRCSEYEKKVSLWVKKKLDNDLHDNTE